MLRKLLALQLLPAEHIQSAFDAISSASVPDAAAVDQQYCCRTSVRHGCRAQYGPQTTCLYTAITYAPTTTWKERQIWPDIKSSIPFGGQWVI